MGDNYWSVSGCRGDVWWYGIPGQGSHYWTARFGQYFVGGAVYQRYSWYGYECGFLGPPVKAYGYISEFGGGEGMWFQGGVILYRYTTRAWTVYSGDYGQTAGRLAEEPVDESQYTELEDGPPGDWSTLDNYVTPKAPKLTAKMKKLAADA